MQLVAESVSLLVKALNDIATIIAEHRSLPQGFDTTVITDSDYLAIS